MRHIDLESHTPNEDEKLQKEEWLKKSEELKRKLIELHEQGDIEGRNKLIKDNSAHWGKVKEWLLSLSHNKCWFSEARDIFSHMDVEHFRPKLEAKDLDDEQVRDGYWWLAFDYHNFRACGNVGNRKKGGWFPLQKDSIVSTYDFPREESEIHILLDPTDADDVGLLAFDEEGKAISAPDNADWEALRVEVTVERLKLNEHEPLSEARRKIWQRMAREIDLYQRYKLRCRVGGNPAAKAKVKEHAQRIREMTRETEELSSVAKWCILFRNDLQLNKLIC